jgi:hypothetical protein
VYNYHNSEHIHRPVFCLETWCFGDWILSVFRTQSPKRCVLNKRQDDGYVQNCDNYINTPSSRNVFPVSYGQTYRVEF